ncbi:MAG: tetratricopeptide repeat protein [Myxococcota bacterium]
MHVRSLLFSLPLLATACAPTIVVRYDVPAAVHFGNAVQNVYVGYTLGDPDVLTVLDPLSALVRTAVAPDVAQHLEQQLVNARRFNVTLGCQPPCPQADTRFEVEMDTSSVHRGEVETESSSGTETTASAGVKVRVLNRDGSSRYEATYTGRASAGVPRAGRAQPDDVQLVRSAAFNAVDQFIADLEPSVGQVSFALEDDGPLEPGVALAMDGDLDGAWASFQQVIQQDPGNAAALYDLGVVMTAKGELELARDAFAAAARLDPQYADEVRGAERRLGTREAMRAQNAQ